MRVPQAWVVVLDRDGRMVPPYYTPPTMDDGGMVYETPKDAEIAAAHQREHYDIPCHAERLVTDAEAELLAACEAAAEMLKNVRGTGILHGWRAINGIDDVIARADAAIAQAKGGE